MNKIILLGNVSYMENLKIIEVESGEKAVLKFSLAIKRPYKEKETDFFNCEVWGKKAETMSALIEVGTRIAVEGYLRVDTLKTKNEIRYFPKILLENFEFAQKKQSEVEE